MALQLFRNTDNCGIGSFYLFKNDKKPCNSYNSKFKKYKVKKTIQLA